ncbi:MAG: DNA polymerase [Paraclostridium sp.]
MILALDLETRSDTDLAKCGVYKYTQDKNFEILLIAYAFDDEEVNIIDLKSGDVIPSRLREAILNPNITKTAFNANFERVCLSKYLNTYLKPESFECTQAKALTLGLVGSLDKLGQILNLPITKDKEGKNLIKYFQKHNPKDDIKKWEHFKNYCKIDCIVERQIRNKLNKFKTPIMEKAIYNLDQRINDIGIKVDTNLIESAMKLDLYYEKILIEKLNKLTNIQNIKSSLQVKKYLETEWGIKVDSLNKEAVKNLLEKTHNEKLKEILVLRQALNKTSIKKYEAMRRTTCSDNRIKGLFRYYGANKTGRWAGKLVQVQNLPQTKKNLSLARDILIQSSRYKNYEESFELLDMLYENPKDLLSELIRTTFVPEDNKKFIISDFSAIEARIIAYISKEFWRNEVFNSHGKIYEASAAKMFKVEIENITKESELRQKGKIAELALGYQGGKNALLKMGADSMGLDDKELGDLVLSFRNSNPNIVRFWKNIESACIKCVKEQISIKLDEYIEIISDSDFLFIKLPSGRRLAYFKPEIEIDAKFNKEVLSYSSVNQTTKRFEKTYTYGGKLTENVVQAIARDVLGVKMLELDKKGFRIVMHVHDEVVLEVDKDTNIDDVNEIMEREISYMKGLNLKADTYESEYYRK